MTAYANESDQDVEVAKAMSLFDQPVEMDKKRGHQYGVVKFGKNGTFVKNQRRSGDSGCVGEKNKTVLKLPFCIYTLICS